MMEMISASLPSLYVIIPVFNRENYIEQCVLSVLRQTYPNVFVICVDDGSTDRSASILDEMAKEYQNLIVLTKENGGCSSARNAGLDYIKKKEGYFTFVDSDDWIEEDYCEQYMGRAIENGFPAIKTSCHVSCAGALGKEEALAALAEHKLFYGPVRTFVSIHAARGLRFDESLIIGEDQLWNVALFYRMNGVFVMPNTGKYHCQDSAGSLTRSAMSNEKLISQFLAWYKCLPFYKGSPSLSIIQGNALADYLELCGKFDRKKTRPEMMVTYNHIQEQVRAQGLLNKSLCPRFLKKKLFLYRYLKVLYQPIYRIALRLK